MLHPQNTGFGSKDDAFYKVRGQMRLHAWFGSASHGTLEDLKKRFLRGNVTRHEVFR